jgi:hypothetical protein
MHLTPHLPISPFYRIFRLLKHIGNRKTEGLQGVARSIKTLGHERVPKDKITANTLQLTALRQLVAKQGIRR